jgi:hypothetical protein
MDKPVDCPLSHAVWEVLMGLALGASVRDIARTTGRSTSTVRTHVHTARRLLGVNTTEQAVLRVRQGWPAPPVEQPDDDLPLALKAYLAAFDRLIVNWRNDLIVHQCKAEMRRLVPAQASGTQGHTPYELDRTFLPGCVA